MIRLGSEPINPANPDVERILYTLNTCPVSYISDDSTDIIEIYGLQERYGGLPLPGKSYLEQPAVLMDALALCKGEFHRVEEYKAREDKKDRAKKAGREDRNRNKRAKHG